MKVSTLGGLALSLFLAGCPGSEGDSSSSPASPSGAPTSSGPNLASEAIVLQVDATIPANRTALENLALDKDKSATLRYAALRRLEEQAPGSAVTVARTLALDPSQTADAAFLKTNSIALLIRAKSPQADDAVALVHSSSLESALLVTKLTAKKGGN